METQDKNKIGFNLKRIIVAVIILPLLISYIYFLPLSFFIGLLLIIAMLAMREFYLMYGLPVSLHVPGVLIGGGLLYLSCRYPIYFLEGIFVSLLLLLILRLFVIKTPSGSMSDIGLLCVGFFYISGFLIFQWFIRIEDNGLKYIFLLYASVWIADSTAYYIGKYLGKNKLYPSVSPNKTIEGAVGSLIGGGLGALLIKYTLEIPDLTASAAISIGIALGIATVIGDLIESMFKRDAGVKDSSGIIPGHGGLLDKIDGLLVAGPVLYLIVRYF